MDTVPQKRALAIQGDTDTPRRFVPFSINVISKDIEDLPVEIRRSSGIEADILKLVEITVHHLETFKTSRDDPGRDLCCDEPWQVLLSALEKFIKAKDPLPDKMMTEWHQLTAKAKVRQKKIEAMEKNLA